jgi:hypothetical protein
MLLPKNWRKWRFLKLKNSCFRKQVDEKWCFILKNSYCRAKSDPTVLNIGIHTYTYVWIRVNIFFLWRVWWLLICKYLPKKQGKICASTKHASACSMIFIFPMEPVESNVCFLIHQRLVHRYLVPITSETGWPDWAIPYFGESFENYDT